MSTPGATAEQLFARAYGGAPNVHVSAPGRVNVIGEHTDYNGGFVMPIAIEKRTHIVGRRNRAGGLCRAVSANEGGEQVIEFVCAVGQLSRGEPAWLNYVKGVVCQYLGDLPGKEVSFDIAVASNVPLGGGLSSSASLEVATAVFLETAYGLRVDPKTRAYRCQKSEHDFAGVPCGIMDQMISSCGLRGHALLIDCIPPCETTPVPLTDASVAFLVTNSNVKHKLDGSEYPARVRECHEASRIIRSKFPDAQHNTGEKPLLRGATMAELLACKDDMSSLEFRRARHVVSEDTRTLDAVEAFRRGDYTTAGRLMIESHNSLRDDFCVSTSELDALVEIATGCPGVYGARMTGGGFGGCTVTLLRAECADAVCRTIKEEYEKRTGKKPTCFLTKPGPGPAVHRRPLSAGVPVLAAVAVAIAAALCMVVLRKARAT